jgi:glutathione S-transferase
MAIKLHRCSATWAKLGGHPCWRAQKALDEAGIDYELVLHSGLRFRRPEVVAQTGQRKVPYVEFEDGTTLLESSEIAGRAQNGTLIPPPATPADAPPS